MTIQPYDGSYYDSKYAIESFTRALCQETAQFGVSASTIRPGAIESEVFTQREGRHPLEPKLSRVGRLDAGTHAEREQKGFGLSMTKNSE